MIMKKIVMICTEGNSATYVYNKIIQEHEIEDVLIVTKEDTRLFLKRRIKKLGYLTVFGQILFILYSKIILNRNSKKRIKEIQDEYNLSNEVIPKYKKTYIDSVNSKEMFKILKDLNPDIVIINGTPIIKKQILESINAYFVNIHVGITPKYRGVHGGYWSLYNNDKNLVGVTTHLVDQGIDSGGILEQKFVKITENDNFLTYPHLQLGAALENYNNILDSILKDDVTIKDPVTNESEIWYHPTIFQYLYGILFKNVK